MPLRPTSQAKLKPKPATWSEPAQTPRWPRPKGAQLLGNPWARMMAAQNRIGRMF